MAVRWWKILILSITMSTAGCGFLNEFVERESLGVSSLSINSPAEATNLVYASNHDMTFILTNSGGAPITDLQFSGLASPFSNVGGTCLTTLGAGESCTYVVRFTSAGENTFVDTLIIDYRDRRGAHRLIKELTGTGTRAAASVLAVYPPDLAQPSKSRWSYYVKNDDGTKDAYNQDNVACDGSESGYYSSACIHVGEKFKVEVAGKTTCTNLTTVDQQGFFDWTCQVDSGSGYATFYSSGLKSSVELKNLIDFGVPEWKDNRVTVYENGVVALESSPSKWWDNPFQPLPDNSATSVITLDGTDSDAGGPDQVFSEGTVFYLAANQTSPGIVFGLDRLTLVMDSGVTLTYNGSASSSCNSNTGAEAGADRRCLFSMGNRNFVWVSGRFNGSAVPNSTQRVVMPIGKFNVLKDAYVTGSTSAGIVSNNFVSGYVDNVEGTANGTCGISIYASHYNTFNRLAIHSNTEDGVRFSDPSTYNTFEDSAFYSNGHSGLAIENTSTYNSVRDSIAYSNGQVGFEIYNSEHNTLRNVKAYNNSGNYGIFVHQGAHYTTLRNAEAANNTAGGGIGCYLSDNVTATNLKAFNNKVDGLRANGCSDFILVGGLSTSNEGSGVIIGGDRSVASHLTIVNNGGSGFHAGSLNGTYSQILSVNNTDYGIFLSQSENKISNVASFFNGGYGIYVYDSGNHTFSHNILVGGHADNCHVAGTTPSPGIDTDCVLTDASVGLGTVRTGVDFAGVMAGMISTDTTNSTHLSGAQAYVTTIDWFTFDSPYRFWGNQGSAFPDATNRDNCEGGTCQIWDARLYTSATEVFNRSGNGSTANSSFVAGSSCISEVEGSFYLTDQRLVTQDYLINATEKIDDTVGDDDGLCEDNEACIYSPHYGYYQGEGTLSATCSPTTGTVSGVTVSAWSVLGL